MFDVFFFLLAPCGAVNTRLGGRLPVPGKCMLESLLLWFLWPIKLKEATVWTIFFTVLNFNVTLLALDCTMSDNEFNVLASWSLINSSESISKYRNKRSSSTTLEGGDLPKSLSLPSA